MPVMTPSPLSNSRRRTAAVLLAASVGASLIVPASAAALDPSEKDPRKIAQAMHDRDTGDHASSRIKLVLTDASGRERVRQMSSMRLQFDQGEKTVMFFEAPADVRNTGLLSVDYDEGAKEDDQWLYLPSLHRSTRISTADKSGSFMGTDISYSDMTKKDPTQYDYTMVEQSTKVGGEDCWLIEARPRTEKEKKETGYLKTHTWVSKQKLMPVQTKAWIAEGKKLKYIKFGEFEKIDGIWVNKKMVVRTVRGTAVESQTIFETSAIKFNQPNVTDDQFTERRLEKGL